MHFMNVALVFLCNRKLTLIATTQTYTKYKGKSQTVVARLAIHHLLCNATGVQLYILHFAIVNIANCNYMGESEFLHRIYIIHVITV